MLGLVGREEEIAFLHAFMNGAERGPAALVLEGEAGIGKSMLWLAGVEKAREEGFRVLSSRPAEAERGFAHAGLCDLFDDVLDEVLPALSPPRRRALEIALRLEEGADRLDPLALGTAVRGALQALSEDRPLLVAIDDLQWFDASSAGALAFALRRLGDRGLLLLLARRGDGALPSELEQALGAERVKRLTVGPLSVGGLHRLLRDRFSRPFARQTMLRIHEKSGGNPFFALELARVLEADVDPFQPLPVPQTLEELVRERISRLPAPTRKALALAAAFGTASESLLERAGVSADALHPAVAAQVIEPEKGTIRFTHPLLSSVLYRDLGEERLSVHARIAGIVDDRLLRARHLALSKETPDAEVAAVLDDAAGLAADRGASAAAAELAEQALRLTPPDRRDDRRRRALAAARAHHAAGEWTRARTIATDLLGEAERGLSRAEALVLLAEIESADRAVVLLEEALGEAASRPALQSVIHCRLAWATRFRKGYVRALEHARAALELADSLGDDVLRERAHVVLHHIGWIVGDPEAQLPVQADDFATAVGGEQLVQEATLAVVNTLAPASRRDEARALLERAYREWLERDEPRSARARWASWVGIWPAVGGRQYRRWWEIIPVMDSRATTAYHRVVALHRGRLAFASRADEPWPRRGAVRAAPAPPPRSWTVAL
jgi:hypothetical protein